MRFRFVGILPEPGAEAFVPYFCFRTPSSLILSLSSESGLAYE